jgi:stearoyl-CoA desaturase (delta-9 desaturase)
VQFLLALLAASAGQRGPLWWASHHRHHHLHADRPGDVHSARRDGFLWSHMGWFLARENFAARRELVADLARYPELRFLDRFDVLAPLGLAALLYAAGELAAALAPGLSVTGPQLVVWGFCISTVALCHATFTINSLAHRFGSRRYATADDSRNNLWLALLTLGEGWHNNHHHFPGSARQGFRWYELDLTYYLLRLLAGLGLVSNLREVPAAVLGARRPGRAGPPRPTEDAA